MKLGKETTIYPYNKDFYSVIRHIQKKYPDTKLNVISYKGLKLKSRDVGYYENKKPLNLIIDDDLEKALSRSDTLIVTNIGYEDICRDIVLDELRKAIKDKKNIICAMALFAEELSEIRSLCEHNDVNFFHAYGSNDNYNHYESFDMILSNELYEPEVPVVFFGETYKSTVSLDIILDVRDVFEENGYSVEVVAENTFGSLLSCECFPRFFKGNDMYEHNKIIHFNRYIQMLCEERKPDILFVQLPGLIMQYDSFITNGFGIYPYMISQALKPDFCVTVSDFIRASEDYFELISENILNKFGYPIDIFCLTNQYIHYLPTKILQKVTIRNYDISRISEVLNTFKYEMPVLDGTDRDIGGRIFELILSKLS